MNITIGRLKFNISILVVVVLVFATGYILGTSTKINIADLLVAISTIPISILVMWRENDIKPRFRWRRWYTAILSLLLAITVSLIVTPPTINNPVNYHVAQVSLVFFFIYIILITPALLSCAIQKSKALTNGSS